MQVVLVQMVQKFKVLVVEVVEVGDHLLLIQVQLQQMVQQLYQLQYKVIQSQ